MSPIAIVAISRDRRGQAVNRELPSGGPIHEAVDLTPHRPAAQRIAAVIWRWNCGSFQVESKCPSAL